MKWVTKENLEFKTSISMHFWMLQEIREVILLVTPTIASDALIITIITIKAEWDFKREILLPVPHPVLWFVLMSRKTVTSPY